MRYLLFFVLFLFAACKKSEIPTYTGGDGLSFYTSRYESDSLSYSFAYAAVEKQRDTLYLNMRVVGAAADHPRTVLLKAASGSTAREGIDYQLPDATLPAGALTLRYPVVLLNSPEMKTTTFRLIVEVAANGDFNQGATGQVGLTSDATISRDKMKIDVSGQFIKPGYWSDVEGVFGSFSIAKFRFMAQVTGLTDFSYEAIGTDGLYSLPVKLRNALEKYEAVNGPLIDENNNQVSF